MFKCWLCQVINGRGSRCGIKEPMCTYRRVHWSPIELKIAVCEGQKPHLSSLYVCSYVDSLPSIWVRSDLARSADPRSVKAEWVEETAGMFTIFSEPECSWSSDFVRGGEFGLTTKSVDIRPRDGRAKEARLTFSRKARWNDFTFRSNQTEILGWERKKPPKRVAKRWRRYLEMDNFQLLADAVWW